MIELNRAISAKLFVDFAQARCRHLAWHKSIGDDCLDTVQKMNFQAAELQTEKEIKNWTVRSAQVDADQNLHAVVRVLNCVAHAPSITLRNADVYDGYHNLMSFLDPFCT